MVKKYEKPSLSNPDLICGYCNDLDCDEGDTVDVVDRVSLSCQGVDEHPCAGRHSRLGNLGNRDLLLGNSTSFSGNMGN